MVIVFRDALDLEGQLLIPPRRNASLARACIDTEHFTFMYYSAMQMFSFSHGHSANSRFRRLTRIDGDLTQWYAHADLQ